MIKHREILVAQLWNGHDLVVLKVELSERLQILELLKADLIVTEVKTVQVLKVGEVLLNHFHDLLAR